MEQLRKAATCLLLYACILGTPRAQNAAPGAVSEDAVKAAYLYKLRHFVEWPGTSGQPAEGRTVIGIVGADEVAERLQQMPASREQGKGALLIKRLRNGDALTGVHILFIGDADWRRSAAMVGQAGAQSTLVVSESDDALADGSVINFRHADERVRFEISLDAADKAGLKLSSRLLSLAVSVAREKRK